MNTNRMDSDYIFLVFFTVLCQSAAGIFMLRELLLYYSVNFLNDKHLKIITLLIPGLLILFSVSVASFHLGKPLQAVHTLRNLGSSWLSREILFLLLFCGIIIFCLFADLTTGITWVRIPLSVAGITSAAGLIVSMSGIYMLKSVPVWNTFLTPASFVITAALAAVSLMLIMAAQGYYKESVILAVLNLLLILSLIISVIFYASGKGTSALLFLIIRLTTGLSIVTVSLLIFYNIVPNKMTLRLFLLVLLLTSEITGRCIFYISFYKSGL